MFAILETATLRGVEHWVVRSLYNEMQPGAVACPANVAIGDVFYGGGYYNYVAFERGKPARTLNDAKQERLALLEQFATELRIAVAGTNDASKFAVYQTKFEIACAAMAGEQTALTALTPEATVRGQTPEELAEVVKRLGEKWRGAGIFIDAIYQAHKAKILLLAAIETVDAYEVSRGWEPFA